MLYVVNSAALARVVKRLADKVGLNGRLLIQPWQELPQEQKDEIEAVVAGDEGRGDDG